MLYHNIYQIFCRKVRLAYQNSWDTRCQHIFCCVKISKNRKAEVGDLLLDLLAMFYILYMRINCVHLNHGIVLYIRSSCYKCICNEIVLEDISFYNL